MKARRRILATEVVQTSGMDCGPAALKCLLEGFEIRASYGRLREACQTDVDGSSIDTLEEVARKLGLDAEQIMLPADHLLLSEAECLPAIVVVRMPSGGTHFVVMWRRHGPLLQLMDPSMGRRWVTARQIIKELYIHTTAVSAAAWQEWAGSEPSLAVLRRRVKDLGIGDERLNGSRPLPALDVLDAALRMMESLVRSGALRRGRQAARVLDRFCSRTELIPAQYWTVRLEPGDQVTIRGAVLVHVRGRLAAEAEEPLPAELTAALTEKRSRPGLELLRLLRMDGLFTASALSAALVLAAGGVVVEAVLFMGMVDLGRELGLAGQRLLAVAALVVFLCLLAFLEIPLASSMLRLGRHLEVRLRQAFLEKLPRLSDRYFQSRLKSDMAERSHGIHRVRHLPELGGQLVRAIFELVLTAGGIIWLDPASAPLAFASGGLAMVLPMAVQPVIVERDLRVRTHSGALSRFYLDALLGSVAIRAHGAERAVKRGHADLLGEWARAGMGLQRVAVWVESAELLIGFGLGAWLLLNHLARTGEAGGALLLAYWALNLPVIGQQIAQVTWQYPGHRNATLRLLEPLGALEEKPLGATTTGAPAAGPATRASRDRGMSIAFEAVTVKAGGHAILEDIVLEIAAGEHVAVVGPSGAGKSSLAGILLGWYSASSGRVLIDSEPLDGRTEDLRREIAWVDPSVRLWNRSFYENLRYGASAGAPLRMGEIIEAAELRLVLQKLPDGFETSLGEGGALVSGGEGQRVRLGRAMLRDTARLVILDEPFRGLECGQRRELLARARKLWQHATLLCITHDMSEAAGFDRVIAIEGGRVVEDGIPAKLAAHPGSRYSSMLHAEREVKDALWSDGAWSHMHLEEGKVRV